METGRLIIKVHGLLLHSVNETEFYDRATDLVLAPELKSAFAKYMWLRGEHIVGIKTFLRASTDRQRIPEYTGDRSERLWRIFDECLSKKDNPTIWKTGLRYVRFTLYKYTDTIRSPESDSRLRNMLHNHLFEIEAFFKEFSALRLGNRQLYPYPRV
ncbi:hypothetical protein [Arcticibacter sp. MXS-1]|uniref:hypothetical protein n=1 Tax=Arcticibacter sp. MXS-1 TaxID=3341726 RepID=UPI0035A99A94